MGDSTSRDDIDRANADIWASMLRDAACALSSSDEVLERARMIDYHDGAAAALVNRGWSLHYLGRVKEALRAFSEAEPLIPSSDDALRANFRNGMGSSYFELGLYEDAMVCFEDALAMARKAKAWERAVAVLVNMAWVCEATGRYAAGLPWLSEALTMAMKEGVTESLGSLYSCMASLTRGLGRPEESAKWLDKIESLPGLADDLPTASSLHLERGLLAMDSGDLLRAEELFRRGLDMAPGIDLGLTGVSGRLGLASCLSRQGRHAEAVDVAASVLRQAREQGLDLSVKEACDEYSSILERAGRWEEALFLSKEARAAEQRMRSDAAQFRMELMEERKEALERERELDILQDLNDRLMASNDILQQVTVISHLITSGLAWEDRVSKLYERLATLTGCTVVGIGVLNPGKTGISWPHMIIEGERQATVEQPFKAGVNFASRAILEAAPIIVTDARKERHRLAARYEWEEGVCLSAIFLPLAFHDRGKGVLTIQRAQAGDFPDQAHEILSAIAPLVATAMDNYHAFSRVNELNQALKREKAELELAKERIEHVAMHDPLTGLLNRLAMERFYEMAASTAERSGKRLCLVFIDLNDFKPINDIYGHQAGDEALKAVARALETVTRTGDAKARIGGDEFTVLAQIATEAEAAGVADKVRRRLSFSLNWGQHKLQVSASIGWAVSGEDGSSLDRLIRAADARMYREKSLYKNDKRRRKHSKA